MSQTTHLAREIATQPDDWARAVARLDRFREALPRPGERVATIGCGTSWFMGQAYAARRESLGLGVTDAFAASEHRLGRDYDRVVVVSRSGTTTEVIAVVEQLRAAEVPHVSIMASPGTPVAEASASTILLDDVDEQSVVQTRFATTTLALLRASLGDDLAPVVEQARAVLAEDAIPAFGPVLAAEQLTFLGHDWSIGIANEAALKRWSTAMGRSASPLPAGRCGRSARCPRAWRKRCAVPAPISSTATSTRWPISSGCTGFVSPAPRRPVSTPTRRATSPAASS